MRQPVPPDQGQLCTVSVKQTVACVWSSSGWSTILKQIAAGVASFRLLEG